MPPMAIALSANPTPEKAQFHPPSPSNKSSALFYQDFAGVAPESDPATIDPPAAAPAVIYPETSVEPMSSGESTAQIIAPSVPAPSVPTPSVPAPAPSVTLSDLATDAITQMPADDPLADSSSESELPRFGTRGQDRWYIHGAAATTLDEESHQLVLLGAGISHFFINGHSVNLELNGMAFDQIGEDAVGLNLGLIMRWHFVRQENWSIYLDGGAGLLGTTSNVPNTGSSFNFTPQVGLGSTIGIDDDQRLMFGLRWHHISNADTFDNNPGRDSIFGYLGINLPR